MTREVQPQPRQEQSPSDVPLVDRLLMTVFWMLLGGAAGIKVMQSLWRFLGFDIGEVTIAVPVGGVIGAAVGVLLGLITNPRLLVLMMAVFAGSAAGGVAGRQAWDDIGEIGGQAAGGLVGGIAWAMWLFVDRRRRRLL
jgi:hypothetical protein